MIAEKRDPVRLAPADEVEAHARAVADAAPDLTEAQEEHLRGLLTSPAPTRRGRRVVGETA